MRRTLLPVVLASGLLLTACGTVKINRLVNDPMRYRDKTVTVSGRVVNSFGFMGTGGYQIEDDTGKLYVISNSGVPTKGTQVEVKGRVMNGVTVMGRSFGTALREHRHKIKD